jgi:hypothetical protein
MLFKTTTKLFKGQYQYKVVLVCPGASYFRYDDLDNTLEKLKTASIDLGKTGFTWKHSYIKSREDLDYAFKLQSILSKMTDIDVRVESPWLSVYSNNRKQIIQLANVEKDRVKYICEPSANVTLTEGTIIMPKMNYDYRITLGKTTHENSAFVEWAENNPKLKLTKSAKIDLLRDRTWGGKHFYLTGDNNLLLARMHLGSSIAKIERIVKS